MQITGHSVSPLESQTHRIVTAEPWIVRPATLLDTHQIADIHNQYVGSGPYTMEETKWTDLSVKEMLGQASDRTAMLVCVDQDDQVVAWSKVKHYSERAGYRIACETSIYVSGAVRGRGVGDRLMVDTIAAAARLGYRHATARIIVGNSPSIRLHLKHGFEVVGVQNGIGMIDDQPADVLLLQNSKL